jgi:hypothetical protein
VKWVGLGGEGLQPGLLGHDAADGRRPRARRPRCGNRPVHEVLFPSLRDIRQEFEHNFTGMTAEPVELDALLAARERMMRELQEGLSADERRFLLSLVTAEPEWPLLGVAHESQVLCKIHVLNAPWLQPRDD